MKFELIGGEIINLEHVVRVKSITDHENIKKSYDEQSQTVKTSVDGEPYKIRFFLSIPNSVVDICYKVEVDRDARFKNLVSGMVGD